MNELLEIESERDREGGYGLRMVEAGSILLVLKVLVIQKYFPIINNHVMPVCCQSTQSLCSCKYLI